MTAAAILGTLARHGVSARRDGGTLKLKAVTGTVPADMIELARAHKPELLAVLPDTATTALRTRLRELAAREGLPHALVDCLTDADLHPDGGAHLLSEAGLRRWLHVLQEEGSMRQGIVPAGWTQPCTCERCGPVLLWDGAQPRVLGCPWCHVRRAGGHLPRPAVTCATCAHQQQRPNTSEAGMHGCAKGNGLHHANATHVCDDWRPVPSAGANRP